MDVPVASSPRAGGPRAVLEASVAALQHDTDDVLAVVLATEGSTYARAGALVLFGADDAQVGWLSGGCLEPEVARHARACAERGTLAILDVDTRDDEALLSGSALGCRGLLRVALLPLRALPGWADLVAAWRDLGQPLHVDVHGDGTVAAGVAGTSRHWSLGTSVASDLRDAAWQVRIDPPPAVLMLGAGPEAPLLLPLLRSLGWLATLVERRPRWTFAAVLADHHVAATPEAALARLLPTAPAAADAHDGRRFDAALVMHHHFELDREALAALAVRDIGFVGLLGPVRRREDLFRLLAPAERAALAPRLHSPVGLDLGGHGPEAIALSIAAQLHAYRHAP